SCHDRTVSSSISKAVATSSQLQPSFNKTIALARRATRASLNPSRASARSSMRSAAVRKPEQIMPNIRIAFCDPAKPIFSDAQWVRVYLRYFYRRLQQFNPRRRSKQNVAHHYDLDGRLYSLFLDADRQYSCAYFEHPGQSLDDAQLAEKRHLAAKLLLQPARRVLDIGCGWGGLGLYLAEMTDAQVTGITLSHEQLAVANSRASEKGLSDRAAFRLQDYRDVEGKFDRIVSVGMFEHVGVSFYDTFFRKCANLLADDGVMLLHSIGRSDGPDATSPWIAKYIFPGGYVPSLSEVLPRIEK